MGSSRAAAGPVDVGIAIKDGVNAAREKHGRADEDFGHTFVTLTSPTVDDAVASAGRLRMQPIILTTLTTVGGLLPLALFGGPMWAGMSWAMIVGLSLSTGLTLLVVPTLYAFCFTTFKLKVT